MASSPRGRHNTKVCLPPPWVGEGYGHRGECKAKHLQGKGSTHNDRLPLTSLRACLVCTEVGIKILFTGSTSPPQKDTQSHPITSSACWRNQASAPSLGQGPPPLKNKKGGDVRSHGKSPGPAWAELPGRQDKARARQAQSLPISLYLI